MGRFRRPSIEQTVAAIGDLSVVNPVERAAYSINDGHKQLPKMPPSGSWLSQHQEQGQSFKSYSRRSFTCSPHGHCDTLYIVPIGDFDETRSPSLPALIAYAEAYYGCKVGVLKKVPVTAVQENSRTGDEGQLQIDAEVVRRHLNSMKAPRDSFCLLAITMIDLYIIKNGEAWNFVFGQASLMDGVGVFSFARYDPSGEFLCLQGGQLPPMTPDEYQLLLRRCCRVLTHEGSHVIGLKHCIHFQCLMNGSNHLGESDAAPLHLCPLCLRKLQNGCLFEPRGRYQRLLEWYEEHGFVEDAGWVRSQINVIDTAAGPYVEAEVLSTEGKTDGVVLGRTARLRCEDAKAAAPVSKAATQKPRPQAAGASGKKCPLITCRGKRGCVCPSKQTGKRLGAAAVAVGGLPGGAIAGILL